MSDILIRASLLCDARWSYDDPSGVPDAPLELPETLRGGVEQAAARQGLSPAEWLRRLVAQGLSVDAPKAA